MPKGPRLLVLLALLGASAHAEEAPFTVEKHYKGQFNIGGFLYIFHKSENVERHWVDVRTTGGVITIQSVSLDQEGCSFDTAALPTSLPPGKKLEILVGCDIKEAVIATDRGTYKFNFAKWAD